jgi:Mrp family chromosome partitioning ATPase
MSRNAIVLEKAASEASFPLHTAQIPIEEPLPSGEYVDLIRRLFHSPSAVAVVRSGSRAAVAGVCAGIAAELAAAGKRVVVVPVEKLLRMSAIAAPNKTSFMPGNTRNVWVWPSPLGQQIEFFKSSTAEQGDNWLDCLRRNFDAVLLDCTALDVTPSVAEFALMAEAAVLVAEAGRSTRQQVQRDQRALEIRGVRLAGCVLLRRR